MFEVVERPWGCYEVIAFGEGYRVKRLVVDPGKRLSLQTHNHRSEHWTVAKGRALVTIGTETHLLKVNQSADIPVGTKHRLENPGKILLHVIEVQTGAYLNEDDIVRHEDDYGRVP